MAQQIVAIIPARGGSKGIPGKNLAPLLGRPLIRHSIEHAQGSHRVTRVVISTDDPAIAAVARACGAEAIDRPAALASDEASSESALLHALDQLDQDGTKPDLVVFLQCTSPIRSATDIDAAIAHLESTGADSLLSVSPSHRFLWRDGPNGPEAVNYDHTARPRRQDRPPEYVENGSIYIFRPAGLRRHRNRLHGRIALHVMDAESAAEIDMPADLDIVTSLLQRRNRRDAVATLPRRIGLLVLDFDGVLTDNKVWTDTEGRESVRADRADGMGIEMLRHAGIPLLILSKEQNPVVSARAAKLQVPCLQGIDDKAGALDRLLTDRDISAADVVYVGNDINDLACMQRVGCAVAVADAHPAVHAVANIHLTRTGGDGAVRELAELILSHHQGTTT